MQVDGSTINLRVEPKKSEIRAKSIRELNNVERILKENLDLEEIVL